MERILTGKPGQKLLLLGNEAVVRGALEAGVGLASTYPGTPASEIGDTFAALAKRAGIYFEYCTNEKVATEVAAAAAFAGLRSIVSYKHFGLNVATDSVFPLAYHGVRGGMVIAFSDDPQCWSSGQSEQDSRDYAKIAHMPMLEPSNSQECKDFTKAALELSEKIGIPVLIRLTTRVTHTRNVVRLGKVKKGKTKGDFPKGYAAGSKWRNMPPKILQVHEELNRKLSRLAATDGGKFTKLIGKKLGPFGIISSGVAAEHAQEALHALGINAQLLKIGMSWPVPEKEIRAFIKPLKEVFVVEELEPILEREITGLAKDTNPKLKIHGKDVLPTNGELNPGMLMLALAKLKGRRLSELANHMKKFAKLKPPPRQPVFCPGCPHRSTFYAVRKAAPKNTVFGGDIGCYILGIFEPHETQDFVISMGATNGICHGLSKVTKQPVISFLGDSTFFHAGFPGIANMVFNKSSPLVVILDNRITAMTGHQPNPGMGRTGMGEKTKEISIEDVVKACQADEVVVTNSFNVSQTEKAARDLLKKKGVKVLISKGECRLLYRRRMRKNGVNLPVFEIDPEKCQECGDCIMAFGCPAIHRDGKGKYYIDGDFCWGCGVCAQVCPKGAIKVKIRTGGKEVEG
ncbi:MAG: indolepyruvate ferredoxin oxidoreductase subunit alpha [Candidatus Micrarchaeota archaeon]